jgi:hypothetical protein
MPFERQASKVLVYEHPIDMRTSFDGLHAIASQVIQEDPLSGILSDLLTARRVLCRSFSGIVLGSVMWDSTSLLSRCSAGAARHSGTRSIEPALRLT